MSTIGSGLDIQGIVASLTGAEFKARIVPLQAMQLSKTTQLSLYGQIKASFAKPETFIGWA